VGARGGLASTTPSSASCRPPPDFDDTILCTLRAAVRQPAPAGCRAAVRLEACWLRLHHLLHATGRSPAAGSCRLQGCCSRGLAGSDTTTPCTPAAGSCRLHCCDAAIRQPAPAGCRAAARGEARWLRLHHLLHSAGRHPAAGPGRVQGCGAWGGSLAPTTPSSALCGPPSGSRLRPVAKLQRAGGSCSDDTMFCHLRAAVLQSASAGCWRVPPTALYALPPAL